MILVLWRIVPGSFQKNENEDYFFFYLPVAQNIVHGNGITLHGKIASEYPPGYPVLIAAVLFAAQTTHCNEEVLLRASIAFYLAITAVLIYFISLLLWNPRQALFVSLLWSCYPLVLWSAKQQNSELPFMVFLYGAFLCFLIGWRSAKNKKRYFFSGGILCGVSMLIRPIAIGVGVSMAVLILFWKRYRFRQRLVLGLLIIIGNLIAVIPWEVWMYQKTKEVLLLCRSRDAISMFDGLTFAVWNPEGYRKGVPVPADVRNFMKEIIPKYSDTISTKQVVGMAKTELIKHPSSIIKLLFIKAARSWYATNSNRFESLILVVQFFYLALMLLACRMFWKSRTDCRLPLAIGLVLLVYFWGMTVCVLSIVRYMVPVLGLMVIFFPALRAPGAFPPHRSR